MKPVNLLPEQHRPSRPSGERSGVAYALIGGLAVVLVAVLAYVLTSNEITSKQERAADLERQAEAAKAEAGSLGPVANFLAIKQSREQSVRDLAGRRFDWERLTREIARVIPAGAYVKDLTASVDGQGVGDSSGAQPATAAAAAQTETVSPKLSIAGCATDQRQVAALLVRLKRLHLAQDAVLEESSRVNAKTGSSGTTAAVAPAGGGTVETPCTRYEFTASVTFDPESVTLSSPAGPERVPASLGGGK